MAITYDKDSAMKVQAILSSRDDWHIWPELLTKLTILLCYGSFAYTRTLDLSDSAKACAVPKAVSHLQDFLTTTILLSPFFFSDSFLAKGLVIFDSEAKKILHLVYKFLYSINIFALLLCYGSFAYTRTLDLSDSAKACAVLKAVSHLQDFLATTILLSHFFFSDSFLYVRHV
ncbi:uncharacterized protein ANIA_10687 [Aspergillus nidulans FGSC A4]|uniref:Uncharacterized protein n=1 Tax=Emericella nidulans (strain FGSC A4 / ATCC 38163 / CBS 112.46 / NRRL 194 / M139) TaxID=227321 RepID=C8VGF1_EMENI|nr:hypothetical protein [Aspergillus nidulans FGSC A4]CBF81853.1 TPA: conserved hypothetical protein [Aspergillus nidulans FGSC A4]